MSDKRFIIITVPPRDTRDEFQAIREHLAAQLPSQWALEYPPHITLRTGAIVPHDTIEEFTQGFLEHCKSLNPVTITANSVTVSADATIDAQSHPLIHVPITMNEGLAAHHKHLLAYDAYQKGPQKRYRPHLTLYWGPMSLQAHRDLQTRINLDWDYQKSRIWTIDNICLYANNGEYWEEYVRCDLNNHHATIA